MCVRSNRQQLKYSAGNRSRVFLSSGQVAKLNDSQDFLTPVAAVTMVAAPITALAKSPGGWCLSGFIVQ